MSWIIENSLNTFQLFIVNVLKCGQIPRHVGIIMDGNRRYAKKINADKNVGHNRGFDKLSETLQWCKELGIKEVTVYAFSIENFKRTPEEVDDLLDLATEKFQKLLDEEEKLMAEGVCVRVIGDMTLLRKDLQKLICKVTLLTKHNNKSFLNIAFAYTSREEITSAVKSVVEGVQNKYIDLDDVTVDLVSKCLYTNTSADLLIRTSGEVRFSDFLLWQISDSVIYFTDVLWPEFSFWSFVLCILKYQRSYYCKQNQSCRTSSGDVTHNRDRIDKFVSSLNEKRLDLLQSYTI